MCDISNPINLLRRNQSRSIGRIEQESESMRKMCWNGKEEIQMRRWKMYGNTEKCRTRDQEILSGSKSRNQMAKSGTAMW